jgi:hypothetical protein
MPSLLPLLVPFAAVALASAQGYAVGTTYPVWSNVTGIGTPAMAVAVHYPAAAPGFDVPVLPSVNGWPVVVFLHGFDRLGDDYIDVGRRLAAAGFIAVLPNTSRLDYLGLRDDALAMPSLLTDANSATGTVLQRAMDLGRIGLAGHSMGGGIVGVVLATPGLGYRCGLGLAPVDPAVVFGPIVAQVTVPFGIVAGEGDVTTPPPATAVPYFLTLGTASGLKFLYLMNSDCAHLNIAGLATTPSPAVFPRVMDISVGFFRHFLTEDTAALEHCVGPAALAEPRLVALEQQIAQPQIWVGEPARIGRRVRISVAAEEGLGGVLAAFSFGPGTLTPLGTLLLDSATAFTLATGDADRERRIDASFQVPNNPALVGFTIALQAVGAAASSPLLLGSAIPLTVQP